MGQFHPKENCTFLKLALPPERPAVLPPWRQPKHVAQAESFAKMRSEQMTSHPILIRKASVWVQPVSVLLAGKNVFEKIPTEFSSLVPALSLRGLGTEATSSHL